MTSPTTTVIATLFHFPGRRRSAGVGLHGFAVWLTAFLLAFCLAACGGGDDVIVPGIVTQPASITVHDGEAATFDIAVTGTAPFTYQWRRNGTDIAGATESSYRIAAVDAGTDNAAQFSVVVGNAAGSVASEAATLTVDISVAPVITSPTPQTVIAGATATFNVTATGSDPLQYQWKRDGVDIPGANAASYTTPDTVANDDGATFSVTVSNTAGSATSDAVRLTVTAVIVSPSITMQPVATSVTVGLTATFSVAADGTAPLTYQWKRNGTDIVGATWASYTTAATSLEADNGATFSVVVNNAANAPVTSGEAALTVTAGDVAVAITAQPRNVSVNASQTASFMVVASGTAPQYQWRRDGTAIAGATSATYTLASAAQSDSGARFTVVVSNSLNSVTSETVTLTVGSVGVAPTITTQPQDATVTAPATATFTVAATGTAPFTYQWRKNGSPISGATAATYATPATAVADDGTQFSVVVSNAAGSSEPSNNAKLIVNAAPLPVSITTQPAAATATLGQSATFNVAAAGTAPLSYQWRKNGTAITGATSSSYTTPAVAQADDGALYSVVVNNPVGTAATSSAVRLTVVALQAPVITVQPSSVTALYQSSASFSVTATGSAPLAYQWRKNDTEISGATSATYTIPSVTFYEDGASYTVVVLNAATTRATSNGARLTVTLPPSTVTGLAAGRDHSIALRSDGTVFSWSDWSSDTRANALAGVGDAPVTPGAAVRARNIDGTPVLDATAVSAGSYHSVLVRSNKTVWAWGSTGPYGQNGECPIGDGACETRYSPTQVTAADGAPFGDVVQVAAGRFYYTLALKTDGSVWGWGKNTVGQLGTGDFTSTLNPVPARAAAGGNLGGVTAIAAAYDHALALKADGTVIAWGTNQYGQLGDGAPSSSSALPRTVETAPGVPLANVVAIAAGDGHSLALRGDGSVWSWGYNGEGALGDGTTVNRSRAVQVRDVSGAPLSGVSAIAAGANHSVFLKADGTVMTAGMNNFGQLGDNTTAANQINAVFVRDAANNVFGSVTQISSTAGHTLVKRADGSVWAWGYNASRQLGDTTTVNRRNPVAVPAGS